MDLIEQYRMMHKEAGKFPGLSCLKHSEDIARLVDRHGVRTVLDYGAGKGLQYQIHHLDRRWGVEVKCYDPGYLPFSKLPDERFDAVISTDVLEHIEEQDLPQVLGEIFGKATKFVFLSVCTRQAKKVLPDGRNAHVTVKPEMWWRSFIESKNPGIPCEIVFNA